jgi:hypothetical protein
VTQGVTQTEHRHTLRHRNRPITPGCVTHVTDVTNFCPSVLMTRRTRTMPVTSAPDTVTLTDGFIVTLAALRLAWNLEERGFHVRLADDGGLVVSPNSRITPDDDHAIREHKHELIALTRYVEAIQ